LSAGGSREQKNPVRIWFPFGIDEAPCQFRSSMLSAVFTCSATSGGGGGAWRVKSRITMTSIMNLRKT
jgi:hypothetical protein